MALANWLQLKTTINRHLQHQQALDEYDNAVQKFEASANRRLRVRQMETSTDLTTTDGDVALPTDYLLWRSVLWTGRDPMLELEYVHPAYLDPTATDPQLFAIEGDTLKVRPANDTADAYEFHYYAKIPTLVGNDLNFNWLLTAYPDIYVEGMLVELFALGRNLEAAQLHKQRRDELFAEIIQLSALTTGPSSPSVRTSEYF